MAAIINCLTIFFFLQQKNIALKEKNDNEANNSTFTGLVGNEKLPVQDSNIDPVIETR